MRLLPALLLFASPVAAQAERFAVACEGGASFVHFQEGRPVGPPTVDPTRQVYVIDEEEETVHRALEPRQEFEELCGNERLCFRTFSPGLISIVTERYEPDIEARSELRIDRRTGAAVYQMEVAAGTVRSEMRWDMNCERTEIPIFDTSRNRF